MKNQVIVLLMVGLGLFSISCTNQNTNKQLPDLIVKKVILSNESPEIGEKVYFSAIVQNVGNAATPEGTVVGVGFYPSYTMEFAIAWADTFKTSLKPGEEVLLSANYGMEGKNYWVASSAAYFVTKVDDMNRIEEVNDKNNISVIKINNPYSRVPESSIDKHAADLIITKVEWEPLEPKVGDKVSFKVTVENIGESVTPVDEPIVIDIWTDVDKGLHPKLIYNNPIKPGEKVVVSQIAENTNKSWHPTIVLNGLLRCTLNSDYKIKEQEFNNNIDIQLFDVKAATENTADVSAIDNTVLPDIMVTELSWEPIAPKPGEEVKFFVTIKNIGEAATPDGVTLGFGICTAQTDDQAICWSDNYSKSLAPGESVTLTPNDGLNGKTTWTATQENGLFIASLDDRHRIKESNEHNNLKPMLPKFTLKVD